MGDPQQVPEGTQEGVVSHGRSSRQGSIDGRECRVDWGREFPRGVILPGQH